MPVDTEVLAQLPLFHSLSTTELEEIASRMEPQSLGPERGLIREGDPPGHPIFVLLTGSVEVVKRGLDGRGRIISTLQAPSVFGEIEILAKRPAIASVNTVSDVTLAILSRGEFDEMCQMNRPAALKLVRNLAQVLSYRLAAADERLAAQFDFAGSRDAQSLAKLREVLYVGWRPK